MRLGESIATKLAGALGSWRFITTQSSLICWWFWWNTSPITRAWAFDPPPFILLNLGMSLQSAYTGPVLLMAGGVQDKKDRATLEQSHKLIEKLLQLTDTQQQLLEKLIIQQPVTLVPVTLLVEPLASEFSVVVLDQPKVDLEEAQGN